MTKRRKTRQVWTPLEQLELFKERVDELNSTRLVASGFYLTSRIGWREDEGLKIEQPEVDKDDLRSFLTVFRHFISNDEPTYLFSIFSICHQYLNNENVKNKLIELRKAWKTALENNGIRFTLNKKEIKPEELMDIWINGWSHHNDQEYRKFLKTLIPYEENFIQIFFLDALVESTKVILYVGNVVTIALKENQFRF